MWMVTLLCFVAVPCVLAASLNDEWSVFKNKYGKVYGSVTEEKARRDIWVERAKEIQRHNEDAARGRHSYLMGMNQFGDMTTEELNVLHQSAEKYSGKNSHGQNRKPSTRKTRAEDLPPEVDWRKKGIISPVVFQGNCASGYAFATTGSLSAIIARETGHIQALSEQNLVDCSQKQGNHGCSGGDPANGFLYILYNGIDSNASYPYEAKEGACRYDPRGVVANINGFDQPASGDEANLKFGIAEDGPIAALVDASLSSFTFYSSGVYDDPKCNSTFLNHGMLIVGYGTNHTSGKDFWIMKNTYGVHWGMEGYMLLARNQGNRCGVATRTSFPLG